MWYMPYVRVRRAVLVYACFAIGITLVAIAVNFWLLVAMHIDGGREHAGMHVGIATLLTGSAALVGGLATVLGLNLAAENEGHLELAWTKPISREGYALGVFAVDIAAMAVCILLTMLCGAIVIDVHMGHQAIDFISPEHILRAIAFCGFPLLIYAWITALSASLKRNRAGVAALFWPLMLVIGALAFVQVEALHVIVVTLNTFNPVAIYTTAVTGSSAVAAVYLSGWAISGVLLAAALVQWRRLEI